jgi:hypothetical protein
MDKFSFVLFSIDIPFIERSVQAGIQSILVDCETLGKKERQSSADTEINTHTFDDLARVRKRTSAHLICRINETHADTSNEVAQALDAGADEIFLPMVKTVKEVESALRIIQGKKLGILIETVESLSIMQELAQFPLSSVYVGLNDLAIARESQNIFLPLVDGTLSKIRQTFQHIPFGFGGLTLPEKGFPIPCILLMQEMARLKCQFSFLRRSFHADIQGKNLECAVQSMQTTLKQAFFNRHDEMNQQQELQEKILAWDRS